MSLGDRAQTGIQFLSNLGGGFLDFWTRDARALTWGLKFGLGEIIWGLKIEVPNVLIWAVKTRAGEISEV